MRVLFAKIAAALMLLQLSPGGAFAGAVSYPELTAPLPGKPETTYGDLVRLVLPSAAGGTPAAGRPVRVRHIGGGEDIALQPGEIRELSAVAVRSGGHDRIALLMDMADPVDLLGSAVLALYDVSGDPRLLDAADVSFDRTTFFADPGRVPASADNDLLVTVSVHSNAGQSYAITSPILVLGDRFEPVDSIFTLGEWNCSYDRAQGVEVRQGDGSPFADIAVTLTERVIKSDEDCGGSAFPVPVPRTITVIYHWDGAARKYVPDSDAFEVLARENEERL